MDDIMHPVQRLLKGLASTCDVMFEVLEDRDWERKDGE
jgi:hypothetical protein